jgi:hypothetical protein
MMELKCHQCGLTTKAKLWKNGVHVQADCGECGKFIKFVSRHECDSALEVIGDLPQPVDEPLIKDGKVHMPMPKPIFDMATELKQIVEGLEEIEFKLDLILDHHNIKQEGVKNG